MTGPGSIYYLSPRLAEDLIHRWEARTASEPPRSSGFEEVRGRPTGEASRENPYQLAEEAKQVALSQGLVGGPGEAGGPNPYLLLPAVPVRLWVFRAKGNPRAPMSAFVSAREDPLLSVLMGSPDNVTGWKTPREIDGWIPSDEAGLRHVLRQLRKGEADEDLGPLDWEETVEDAADFAVNITRTPDFSGFAEVLARIYARAEDVTVPLRTQGSRVVGFRFSQVLVGAPVFIRDPSPQG